MVVSASLACSSQGGPGQPLGTQALTPSRVLEVRPLDRLPHRLSLGLAQAEAKGWGLGRFFQIFVPLPYSEGGALSAFFQMRKASIESSRVTEGRQRNLLPCISAGHHEELSSAKGERNGCLRFSC